MVVMLEGSLRRRQAQAAVASSSAAKPVELPSRPVVASRDGADVSAAPAPPSRPAAASLRS